MALSVDDKLTRAIDGAITAMECMGSAALGLTVEMQRMTETFVRYAAVSHQFQQIVNEWYLEVAARRNYRRSAVALTVAVALAAIVGRL